MNIEDYIPEGRENAISRADLKKLTGLSDRRNRAEIKAANLRLKDDRKAILSSSSSTGYWISDNISEMIAYLRESEHRQSVIAKNDLPIFQIVMEITNDKVVPVKRHIRNLSHTKKSRSNQLDGQISIQLE